MINAMTTPLTVAPRLDHDTEWIRAITGRPRAISVAFRPDTKRCADATAAAIKPDLRRRVARATMMDAQLARGERERESERGTLAGRLAKRSRALSNSVDRLQKQ